MKQSRFKYSGTSLAHFDRQGAPKGEARFFDLTARKKKKREKERRDWMQRPCTGYRQHTHFSLTCVCVCQLYIRLSRIWIYLPTNHRAAYYYYSSCCYCWKLLLKWSAHFRFLIWTGAQMKRRQQDAVESGQQRNNLFQSLSILVNFLYFADSVGHCCGTLFVNTKTNLKFDFMYVLYLIFPFLTQFLFTFSHSLVVAHFMYKISIILFCSSLTALFAPGATTSGTAFAFLSRWPECVFFFGLDLFLFFLLHDHLLGTECYCRIHPSHWSVVTLYLFLMDMLLRSAGSSL